MADPIVTASVYCSRHIDDLLREAVAPYRAAMRAELADDGFLWFYRYGKRGEHLKVRVHAPEPRRQPLREQLERAVSGFLETMAGAPPVERISKGALPPLDLEDAGEEDCPDRSLLWTTYQRTPVLVGDPVYVKDDRHMTLFLRALGASADYVLDQVVPASGEPGYLQRRQNSLLKLIIAGMAATDFPAGKWPVYFAYYRDWMIRHLVTVLPSATDAATITAELDGQLDKVRSVLPALARIMAGQRAAGTADGPLAGWSAAAREFFEHIEGYRNRSEYDCDPYTDDHTFLPLFKLFHACANQLGFRISHEAYLHHLLLQAANASLEHEPGAEAQG